MPSSCATPRLRCICGLLLALGLAPASPALASLYPSGFLSLTVGSRPVSAAIGDMNGDARPDIVNCNYNSKTVSVLRNLGGDSFAPHSDFACVASGFPTCVALGDLNGDGKLDVLTANAQAQSISTFLGDGSAGLGARTDVPLGVNTWWVSTGDLNNDTKLDLAVAVEGSIKILFGNGDGTFAAAVTYSTGTGAGYSAYGNLVAIGDLNGDGMPDLAVANAAADAVSVLLNNGDGSFGPKTDYAAQDVPQGVAIGDVNGDGKPDLAVANEFVHTVSVLLGNGDGSFGAQTVYGVGQSPFGVAVGDVNADGKLDLALPNFNGNSLSVLLGNGDGTFGGNTEYASANAPRCIVIGDLNGDGWTDLTTTHQGANTVGVFLGHEDGSFGRDDDPTGSYPNAVVIGDLNGDGNRDLVAANYLGSSVSVLLNEGYGTFGGHTDFATGGRTSGVAIGDLNGDGKPDLAASRYDDSMVSVLLGNGDGTFDTHTDFATGGHPYTMRAADLNGDGKLDVVTTNDSEDEVSVLLGNGDGTLGAPTDFGTGSLPSGLAIGDLNGDGKPDLVTPNSMATGGPTGNTVSVLLGNGDGTFGTNTNFGVGNNPLCVVIGDVNQDGQPDLVTANQLSPHSVSVLLGDGTGSFAPKTDYPTGRNPVSLVIGDLNLDGKVDVVTANAGQNTLSLLAGDGAGAFGDRKDFGVGSGPVDVAIGDLNGDTAPDLVTANQNSNTVSVLLRVAGVGPVPTLLVRFVAEATSDGIQLRWQFQEPERVAGVTLDRSASTLGPWTTLTPEIRRSGVETEALDKTVASGESYYYRLTANLTNGTQAEFGPVSVTTLAGQKVSGLMGISPNPAFSTARIDFAVERHEKIRISVVDVAGRVVAVLADGPMAPGNYSMVWDGKRGPTRAQPGVYFVHSAIDGRTESRRLVLLP